MFVCVCVCVCVCVGVHVCVKSAGVFDCGIVSVEQKNRTKSNLAVNNNGRPSRNNRINQRHLQEDVCKFLLNMLNASVTDIHTQRMFEREREREKE